MSRNIELYRSAHDRRQHASPRARAHTSRGSRLTAAIRRTAAVRYVSVIQISYNFVCRSFQFNKSTSNPTLSSSRPRAYISICSCGREGSHTSPCNHAVDARWRVSLNHYFKLSRRVLSVDKILARSSIREVTRQGGRLCRKFDHNPWSANEDRGSPAHLDLSCCESNVPVPASKR